MHVQIITSFFNSLSYLESCEGIKEVAIDGTKLQEVTIEINYRIPLRIFASTVQSRDNFFALALLFSLFHIPPQPLSLRHCVAHNLEIQISLALALLYYHLILIFCKYEP